VHISQFILQPQEVCVLVAFLTAKSKAFTTEGTGNTEVFQA
jgi:hypothetical protein